MVISRGSKEIPYISTMRREKYQNAGCIDMDKGDRSLLEHIAYTPLRKKPNNAAFISILVSYLCAEN